MPVNPKLALATLLTACAIPLGAVAAGSIARGSADSQASNGPAQLSIPPISIGR